MTDYVGKVALITGGGGGIGRAIAERVHAKGAYVVVADLAADRGELICASLNAKRPESALFVKADVSSWSDQVALFRAAVDKFASIDFVFANAGMGSPLCGFLDDTPDDDGPDAPLVPPPDMTMFRVNVEAVVYTIKLAVDRFRRQARRRPGDGGKILITSSVAGVYPLPAEPFYCATKHALYGLAKSLGPRLAPEGIQINCVGPGPVPTAILPTSLTDVLGGQPGWLTQPDTVVDAFEKLLQDKEGLYSGNLLEVVGETIHRHEPSGYASPTTEAMMKWAFHRGGRMPDPPMP